MANSYVVYPGTGAQTQFVVTFPFLSRTHVDVLVDGVSVSFTWINDGLIECAVAPALAAVVRIERSSSPTEALVNFTAGYLSEADLDTSYLHTFYLAQEAVDTADASITLDATNNWDAQGNRIVNVADGQSAQDAVTKAQLDAISAAAGNVPTPGNPADDNKLLKANGGTFGWGPDISTFGEDLIDSADAAAARTTLDAQEDVMTTNGDLVTRVAGVTARLAIGTDGQALTLVSGLPAWVNRPGTVVTTISGTTHSPAAADIGKTFVYTNAAGCAVTLPSTATVGDGYWIEVLNASAGNVTLTRGGSDDVDGGGTAVIVQNGTGRNRMLWRVLNGDWYTSERVFVSAAQTITSAGALTIAHGLGAIPKRVHLVYKNTTAELNYSIGDEVMLALGGFDIAATGNHGISLVKDATNLNVRFGSAAAVYAVPNKTTGANAAATNGSWNAIFIAEF